MNPLAGSSPTFRIQREHAHLRCEIKFDFDELEALAGDWARVQQLSSSAEIFQTFAWMRAFWRTYKGSFGLCTPVVYDGDTVIGIFPLISDGGTLRMLGYGHSDYNDIICAEGDAPSVLELSLKALCASNTWHHCEFDQLPADGLLARHLASVGRKLQLGVQAVFRAPCPTFKTGGASGLFTRLANKKHIKRQRNRLERIGHASFRHLESADEVREHLPRLFQQHIDRRAMLRQTSRLQQLEAQQFHYELVAELDARGPLRFSVLELDGRALAYHLGFEFQRKFLFYTAGFDPEFLAYSPGEVLLGKLLEYAESRRLEEFDFGIGGEMYKRRFSNHIKHNLTVYITRRPAWLPLSITRKAMGALRLHKETAEQRAYEQRKSLPGSVRVLNQLVSTRSAIRGYGFSGWLTHQVDSLKRQLMPLKQGHVTREEKYGGKHDRAIGRS